MSVIQLSDAELSMLRMHYLQEYNQTAKKLEEINIILNKLGISNNGFGAKKITNLKPPVAEPIPALTKPTKALVSKTKGLRKSIVTKKAAVPVKTEVKGVVKNKRAKKISWPKFIVLTLKNSKTPMSAPELLEAGKDQFTVNDSNRTKAMQALQAALYRLSKKDNVLAAEKTKGAYVGYFINKQK